MSVLSPLTGTEDTKLLRVYSVAKIREDWIKSFQIDISGECLGQDKFYLYECKRTGLKFYYPHEIVGSPKLYEKLQSFVWYYVPDKWEHHVALNAIKKYDRVLEVGAGSGSFVSQCLRKGINIVGLELNKSAVETAQARGLPIKSDCLENYTKNRSDYFDVVCAFQVLEHVSDPHMLLEQMSGVLKKGGRLMISLPNANSFLKYDYNLLDMPPHHMTLWNKHSLNALPQLFPFKLKRILYEPLAKHHIEYFINVYHAHFQYRFNLKHGFPKRSLHIVELLLKAGLRMLFRGQGIFAEYIKYE